MRSEYAKFAIEGNPVLSFWTIACFAYLYNSTQWWGFAIGIGVTSISASISYYELDRLVDQIEKASRRSKVGRSSENSAREQVRDLYNNGVFDGGIPPGGYWIAFNGVLGVAGLVFLTGILLSGETGFVALFLAVIPAVWFTAILWRVYKNLW